jgi:hypothetical protein
MKRNIGDIWTRSTKVVYKKSSHIKTEMYIKTTEGTKLYHRFLVEQFLGFPIPPGIVVHHINDVHSDNRLENFLLIPTALHFHIHRCRAIGIFVSNLQLMKDKWSKK